MAFWVLLSSIMVHSEFVQYFPITRDSPDYIIRETLYKKIHDDGFGYTVGYIFKI